MFEDYYSSYGIDYADADILNYGSDYAMNVGSYDSMYSYNEAMLRKRQPQNVYSANQGYEWQWTSINHRLKYKRMFETSRDLDKIGDFAIASLIINRMIATINYMYYSRTGTNLKVSSNLSKSDQNTILFNLKYNF